MIFYQKERKKHLQIDRKTRSFTGEELIKYHLGQS